MTYEVFKASKNVPKTIQFEIISPHVGIFLPILVHFRIVPFSLPEFKISLNKTLKFWKLKKQVTF